MLIFKRLIHSASRCFPQWVELHYDDMDKLHPPWPLPPAVSGQRPVSRVPAAAAQGPIIRGGRRGVGRAAGGWAEAHGGGPGETHGGVMITCLQDCRNCFRVILSGDNRVKNIDSPYHSAEIGYHDCFYNADHVYEIQGILLGSDGW